MFRQAPSFPYHDLGIVEDGNTASRAISKDAYVIWKGSSYFASTDILQGATLEEDVNLTAIPDGVINGVVDAANNKFTWKLLTDSPTQGTPITVPEDATELLFLGIQTGSQFNNRVCDSVTYPVSRFRDQQTTGIGDSSSFALLFLGGDLIVRIDKYSSTQIVVGSIVSNGVEIYYR